MVESFLEDINSIFYGSEIFNIMAADDLEEIYSEMKQILKDKGIQESMENSIKVMKELFDQNLHVVLAFSPVGDKLRNRCRQVKYQQ